MAMARLQKSCSIPKVQFDAQLLEQQQEEVAHAMAARAAAAEPSARVKAGSKGHFVANRFRTSSGCEANITNVISNAHAAARCTRRGNRTLLVATNSDFMAHSVWHRIAQLFSAFVATRLAACAREADPVACAHRPVAPSEHAHGMSAPVDLFPITCTVHTGAADPTSAWPTEAQEARELPRLLRSTGWPVFLGGGRILRRVLYKLGMWPHGLPATRQQTDVLDSLRREVDLCDYELVSVMPSNGLLWQVAYDRSLSCAGVQPALFQAFVSTLRRGLLGYDTWPPVGVDVPARACIINRNDSRAIRNAHVIDAELRRLCIGAQRRRVMTTHLELTASQTLREQALMLEPCDLLIGAHGAGLTNALFMRPGSALVEFSSTANKNYRTLAHLLGHSYFARRVACEAPWACVGQATVISPHDARPQSAAGFVLEAAAVREVLSAALAAAAQSGGRDETEMVSSTCGGLEVSQDGPVGGRPYKLPKVKLGVKLQNVSPAREAEHTYSTASISHRKELHRAAPSQISSAAAKAFWAKPVWDSSQQSEERNQYPPPKIKVDINGRSVVAHPKVKPPKTAKVKPPKPTSSGEASHLSGGGRFPFSPGGFSDRVYQGRVLEYLYR